MPCKIGAIGLGHWFFRLHDEIKRNGKIELAKAAATSDYETKKILLDELGITKEQYYVIKPGEPIPEEFMKDLDVVYISTPNEFHAAATKQALEAGKCVITEKTYGIIKQEFMDVVDYIKANKKENSSYLHLHYLHKPMVMQLPEIMSKISKEHGKVEKFAAVFWEEANDIDRKRAAWLLNEKNGGIFMDWVHPFEVLFKGAEAKSVSLTEVQLNEFNSSYSTEYPTGVDAKAIIDGNYFVDKCEATIRVGKGLPKGYGRKIVQMRFASGAILHLSFVSYENELDNFQTGYWELTEKDATSTSKALGFGRPESGERDLFTKSIQKMCNGEGPDLSLDDAVRIFEPQWDYQELAKGKKLVKFTPDMMEVGWALV